MALIHYITQIQIDFGALALLPQECERVGIARPLVVTDAGVRAAGLLDRRSTRSAACRTPCSTRRRRTRPRPPCAPPSTVYRENGCDGLIAVGGGSSIDLRQGRRDRRHARRPAHDLRHHRRRQPEASPSAVAPLIAVPTTAGTGSEVARGAIVIVDDGRKLGFHSWHLVPKAAICDPELTLGLPPSLTAATGMDAIAHCMETFMSAGRQSAGRRHRARRPASAPGGTSSARPRTAATARRAGT